MNADRIPLLPLLEDQPLGMVAEGGRADFESGEPGLSSRLLEPGAGTR